MTSTSLTSAIDSQNIVPDVLSYLPSDVQELEVLFDDVKLTPGKVLQRSSTLNKPDVRYQGAKEGQKYVLIMVDPDLFKTNDPTGQVRHWLEIATFPSVGKTATTVKEITSYLPCTPGVGSGNHRYIFLLCQPQSNQEGVKDLEQGFVTKNTPGEDLKDRMGFYVDKFIKVKGLTVLAINFMLVGADVASAFENIGAGAQAVFNKVTGQ